MDDDDILERVRRGVGGIHPDHQAAGLVHRQVRRRRRRRRIVGGVAAAAVVAAAVRARLALCPAVASAYSSEALSRFRGWKAGDATSSRR